ncbi:MAG: ferredoxin [Pseudomonadota bacterium]
MRVHIHQDKCVGAGQCVLAAPDVFDQREEDGVVVLLMEHPPEALAAAVRKAAKLCPAQAITVLQD